MMTIKKTPTELRKERTKLINEIKETARRYLENMKEQAEETPNPFMEDDEIEARANGEYLFKDEEYTKVDSDVSYTDNKISCRVVGVSLVGNDVKVNLHDADTDTYFEKYLEYLSIDDQLEVLDVISGIE